MATIKHERERERDRDRIPPGAPMTRMADCPHCGTSLELVVETATIPVHREERTDEIEPDVFRCAACDAVLFATVSRELERL